MLFSPNLSCQLKTPLSDIEKSRLETEACQENLTDAKQKLKQFAIACTIQELTFKDGVKCSMWNIYKVVEEAYTIAIYYGDIPLNTDMLAKFLIIFAYKETGFTPGMIGTHGEKGICQTMPEDIDRLTKMAEARGLKFKHNMKAIHTGLILCAEEFAEKIRNSKGNINAGIWRYNGNRKYGVEFKKLLNHIKNINGAD